MGLIGLTHWRTTSRQLMKMVEWGVVGAEIMSVDIDREAVKVGR